MPYQIFTSLLLVDVSVQEQEFLTGGQASQVLAPVEALRGKPVTALGKALKDGSEMELGKNTLRGFTNSGPSGSLGNSNAEGEATKTGAEDIMVLPPFLGSSQTF
ncbi:MAG TPA: hypothetical protein VK184_22595 [Nostocaceae cyanobacterium]|nr:hypothetical protein [Nostocaceae cyanobacterium]